MKKPMMKKGMAYKKSDDTTYPEGPTINISNSKRISEKKYNRKLKKAKEGEVTQNQQDKHGFFGEKESFSVRNTNVNKKNKVFIKRETPDSDYNNTSYLKVKTKPTRKEKKYQKWYEEVNKENDIYNSSPSLKSDKRIAQDYARNAEADGNTAAGRYEAKKAVEAAAMKKGTPMHKYGAMKGDQSATKSDYKNYKGTDKGYHGETGSSHGDQSATRPDYRERMTRNSR